MALLELVKSFSVFLSSYLLNSDPEYDAKIRKKPGEKTDPKFCMRNMFAVWTILVNTLSNRSS